MLYDPKWEQETKADPFSLESLIAWLETKPPQEKYDFCEWNNCLLAQWLQSIDPSAKVEQGGPHGYYYRALGRSIDLYRFQKIATSDRYWVAKNMTFGAALKRARKLARM